MVESRSKLRLPEKESAESSEATSLTVTVESASTGSTQPVEVKPEVSLIKEPTSSNCRISS